MFSIKVKEFKAYPFSMYILSFTSLLFLISSCNLTPAADDGCDAVADAAGDICCCRLGRGGGGAKAGDGEKLP